MSRQQQDQFIDDDEEETCPLCVEEFDIGDRGFWPCTCNYQICQFCYHNVKTNLNGLCPACRRPYNDKDIRTNIPSLEEIAAYKAKQAQKAKKTQAAAQKEAQKREADTLSRKHLAGLRVVQKNLVYVTGLNPTSQEDQLLQTLRGDQYFGQYGKIIKIVVSKAKDPSHPHSVGVYVTYERKEDAHSCITAVDGSKNGERTLRAQFGTTKYCSAFLRNETCNNRNCMFLHEPGEANESYSRADLSSLNVASTQSNSSSRLPPPQSQQPVASASQPMDRQNSTDYTQSSTEPEQPALPSTVSWASKPQQPSRAESRSTSGTMASPSTSTAAPAQPEPAPATPVADTPEPAEQPYEPPVVPRPAPITQRVRRPQSVSPLMGLIKAIAESDINFVFSAATLSESDAGIVTNYPPLFDENGAAKRRARRQQEEQRWRLEEQTQLALQHAPSVDTDERPEVSGSLQLGGEPDEPGHGQGQLGIPQSLQGGILDQRFQFGNEHSDMDISGRGLTPQQQQQQQLLLQNFKSPDGQASFLGHEPNASQPPSHPPGHARNQSRYSFANETSSASATVKPVANAKLMNQQSAMMPLQSQHPKMFQQPNQFYTSTVQGPPPGLKTTGTPPVSGGAIFGQGHGFATGGLASGYGAANRNQGQEEMYRDLMRTGSRADPIAAAQAAAAKREYNVFPSASNPNNGFAYPAAYASAGYVDVAGGLDKRGKKKGKKHRHGANTSSSSGGGGSAAMDVADPNHPLRHQLGSAGASVFGGAQGGQGGLQHSMMYGGAGFGGSRW